MNICNDKPSTCRQILTHVKKSETAMHDVRDLLLDILMQYQQADKVGFSLGVLDKVSSFSDKVSWCSIIGKLGHHKQILDKTSMAHLISSVDYLDELTTTFTDNVILKIQKYRDLWMQKVLMWDLVIFTLLLSVMAAGVYWFTAGFDSSHYIEFVKQRPFFFFLAGFSTVFILFVIHFIVRRKVINSIAKDIGDDFSPGMNLENALNYNARINHSIFRPIPVGWNFIQRQKIESVSNRLPGIREKLANVLANYTVKKTA